VAAPTQDARQRRLADLERHAPQIRAVQLEQVEGVEEGVGLVAAAEDIEPGEPALVAAEADEADAGRGMVCLCAGVLVSWWWIVVRADTSVRVGVSPALGSRLLARAESRGGLKSASSSPETWSEKNRLCGLGGGSAYQRVSGRRFS
jgi:hypothetical protein